MKRQMIKIDEELCNGCGLCAEACHEGAIGIVDGKAKLLRDDYCDGLGNCLPVCPTGAIQFEEREAVPFSPEAVIAKKAEAKHDTHARHSEGNGPHLGGGCPGSRAAVLRSAPTPVTDPARPSLADRDKAEASALMQWPVQIKLLPVVAPYYQGAHLLIAADCTAFSRKDFHDRFMRSRITMIGCPKLDEGSYAEKLTAILENNDIASVTIVRMEVPCCGGLSSAAVEALRACGKMIPWQTVTISVNGEIL